MQLGIFAKTFDTIGATATLEAVARAGYSTTQFNMANLGMPSMPDRIDAATARSVAYAVERTGVSVAAISGTYNMIHPSQAVRKEGMSRLAVLAASCVSMGANLITLCTGTRDPDDQWRAHPDNSGAQAWRDLRAEMTTALDIAERFGILLGVEPELANVVSSATAARRLLDEVASPRLRIVLDPANLFEIADERERRAIVERAVDLLGPAIAMAHAKDRTANGGFTAPGRGVIDFRHFVDRLWRVGFDGPLVTHGLAADDAPRVAKYLRTILNEAEG